MIYFYILIILFIIIAMILKKDYDTVKSLENKLFYRYK